MDPGGRGPTDLGYSVRRGAVTGTARLEAGARPVPRPSSRKLFLYLSPIVYCLPKKSSGVATLNSCVEKCADVNCLRK